MGSWSVWLIRAVENIELKSNITIVRDWFSSDWRNDMSASPNVVCWACEFCGITLMQLENGKLPTFKNLLASNSESFWISPVLLS
jgi:hypothetical protein